MLRRLTLEDLDEAARIFRTSFDAALPTLAGLHTPAEDRWFFRERLFPKCELWGAGLGDGLQAVMAVGGGWIEQLYVLPEAQGQGLGSVLVTTATELYPELDLWTFQSNAAARRFYERRAFTLVETTDGARNEEREPDAHYRWVRDRH